jgi:hypothetical protein
VRALSLNTKLRVAVALVGLLAAILLLASCGGSSGPSAQSLVNDTFSSHTPIESANLAFTLSFTPKGVAPPSPKGLEVDLNGPFQDTGPGKLPRFDLTVGLSAGGHEIHAGAIATGSQLFIQLGGSWFQAPEATYKSIEQGYAQATKNAQSRSTFASLGIDPSKWIVKPVNSYSTAVVGEPVYHVYGEVDVNAFLKDVSKLSQAAGPLGSSVPGASALTPAAVDELARAVHSAHVDIFTGKDDHLLRTLEVAAQMSSTPQTHPFLNGANEAEVELTVLLTKLNKPQTITAPANPKPFSQLLPALQQLLTSLQSAAGG